MGYLHAADAPATFAELVKPQMAYHGPVSEVLPYFAARGHICPPQFNPADFISALVAYRRRGQRSQATLTAAKRAHVPTATPTVSLMVDFPDAAEKLVADYRRLHRPLDEAPPTPPTDEPSPPPTAGGAGGEPPPGGGGGPHRLSNKEERERLKELGHLWEATWWTQFRVLFRRRCAHRPEHAR